MSVLLDSENEPEDVSVFLQVQVTEPAIDEFRVWMVNRDEFQPSGDTSGRDSIIKNIPTEDGWRAGSQFGASSESHIEAREIRCCFPVIGHLNKETSLAADPLNIPAASQIGTL
jgi:hypothetical protein